MQTAEQYNRLRGHMLTMAVLDALKRLQADGAELTQEAVKTNIADLHAISDLHERTKLHGRIGIRLDILRNAGVLTYEANWNKEKRCMQTNITLIENGTN